MSRPHTRTAFGAPASRRGAPPGSGLTSSGQKRYHWSRSSRGKHENKRADILSEETPVIETQGGSQRGRERRGPPRRANRPQGQKEEGSPGGKRVGQLMRAAAPSPRGSHSSEIPKRPSGGPVPACPPSILSRICPDLSAIPAARPWSRTPGLPLPSPVVNSVLLLRSQTPAGDVTIVCSFALA